MSDRRKQEARSSMHHPTPPKQAASADGRRAPARSMLRFSSSQGSSHNNSSSIPTVTASPAALPTINNRILQQHAAQFQALQQRMLEAHVRQPQHACAEGPEDDAPLPAVRYAHMCDMLLPERDPGTFEAWKAQLEAKLQQRLQRGQQKPPAAAGTLAAS